MAEKRQFENDMKAIRRNFGFFYWTISERERRKNSHLYKRMKYAIHQLNLCRELARSLDGEIDQLRV
jgi:hypothetical protein